MLRMEAPHKAKDVAVPRRPSGGAQAALPGCQRIRRRGLYASASAEAKPPGRVQPGANGCTSLPQHRDGYPSRLFFAEKVQSKAVPEPNWNANGARIAERNWHAFSWKTNPNLRLAQMVAAHLRAHPMNINVRIPRIIRRRASRLVATPWVCGRADRIP